MIKDQVTIHTLTLIHPGATHRNTPSRNQQCKSTFSSPISSRRP